MRNGRRNLIRYTEWYGTYQKAEKLAKEALHSKKGHLQAYEKGLSKMRESVQKMDEEELEIM